MKRVQCSIDGVLTELDPEVSLLAHLRQERRLDGLCYHPKLESEKNCGSCLVEVQWPFESRRQLKAACAVYPVHELKVWTNSNELKNLKKSILGHYLSFFPRLLLLTSRRLRQKLMGLRGPVDLLTTQIPVREVRDEASSLFGQTSFYQARCIGCGLCLDFEKKLNPTPGLKLEFGKRGQFVLKSESREVEKLALYEKSLSLICPTEALSHPLENQVDSTVLPAHKTWFVETPWGKVECSTWRQRLEVRPSEGEPHLKNAVYERMHRYRQDEAMAVPLGQPTSLEGHSLCWVLGENLDPRLEKELEQIVHDRRERIESYKTHELRSAHPLSPARDKMSFFVILGPEDELTNQDWSHYQGRLVGVMYSRHEQWKVDKKKAKEVRRWPVFDLFERGADESFQRHWRHCWRELGL